MSFVLSLHNHIPKGGGGGVFLQRLTDSCSALHAIATLPSSISQPLLLSQRNGQHTCSAFSHALKGLLKLLLQYVRTTLLSQWRWSERGISCSQFCCMQETGRTASSKTPHRTRTSLRTFRLFSRNLSHAETRFSQVSLFVLYKLRVFPPLPSYAGTAQAGGGASRCSMQKEGIYWRWF
ncbi:hypothetical protein CNYM01_14249 [Colletotrichum nymphaeae SA-01]|uniref:Uncharacterized protein n=1 Tax=Colletotrichum nymphaeae SA-01 TaxID=1460502 RepID=A0A135UPF7_9PEZI|nr:hypothetical protein CNYM01_14249 [Colletotrichum nymphaeae SA-01]